MKQPSLVTVVLFVLASALSWWVCRAAIRWRLLRLPLAVYCGAYVLTTGIGAAAIGLLGPEVMPATWGMDFSDLQEPGLTYWLLLFLPLLVPPLVAILLAGDRGDETATTPRIPALSPFAILIPFLSIAAYCVYTLVGSGFAATLTDTQTISADFKTLMTLRSDMLTSLGGVFFGFVYTTLPTLCQCALFVAAKRRRRSDWLLFLTILGTTALFDLAVVQKTLILVLFMFTAVAAVELRLVSGRVFALAGLGGLVLLGLLQLIFQGESWTMLDSLALIIFRLSSSFPYYVDLYPNILPFGGVDLGLYVVGVGTIPHDQLDVFERTYPQVHIEGAAAAAAAHLRAYSQAGVVWAVVTAGLIGVALYFIARWRRRVGGPLSFALFIQLLVALYYATQTSLSETFIASYGLIWSLFGLALVATTQALLWPGSKPATSEIG